MIEARYHLETTSRVHMRAAKLHKVAFVAKRALLMTIRGVWSLGQTQLVEWSWAGASKRLGAISKLLLIRGVLK